MPKKIAVVTATRAEFGLLSPLCHALENSPLFELQLMVTGAHLLASQGNTLQEIQQQDLPITEILPILEDAPETDLSQANATAKALSLFAKAFKQHAPQAVIVLGDRYELLGICSAALLMHTPIIHLHGGEVTEGAMDEAIRHAVTKLAHVHFVAAEPYRKRVIQMGEHPDTVFNVGAPGLDVIAQTKFLSITELEADLKLSLTQPLFLITYQPVTWGEASPEQTVQHLITALENFPEATVIWTAANTDACGQKINDIAQNWAENTMLNAKFVTSLGSQRYLSLMALAQAVIGNSSSGIIEAPALKTPTVNIGERQAGRLMANSIIQVSDSVSAITEGIKTALAYDCDKIVSLYGQGDTVKAILNQLETTDLTALKHKIFFDIEATL